MKFLIKKTPPFHTKVRVKRRGLTFICAERHHTLFTILRFFYVNYTDVFCIFHNIHFIEKCYSILMVSATSFYLTLFCVGIKKQIVSKLVCDKQFRKFYRIIKCTISCKSSSKSSHFLLEYV